MKHRIIFKTICFYWFIAQVCFGCMDYPKDPNDTLKRVAGGTMVVGFSENAPWVIKTEGEPEGIEPELIKLFALGVRAKITWEGGSEELLFKKLENKKMDVIIAGLTDESPWKTRMIGFTKPYITKANEKHVMAVQEGENAFLIELEKFLYENKSAEHK